jgi:hypothetical protein
MPGKSTGLSGKPRAPKTSYGSKRFGSSNSKPADQRRIRLPVLGGGAQVSKPRRRISTRLPGCLIPTTCILLGILAGILLISTL